MLRLHIDRFWISPYAFSSFVALEEKRIPFELVEVGLDRGDQRAASYQKHSLTGRVPVLYHEVDGSGFWLSESDAINNFLEEAFPPPAHPRLFPEDLRERARARQLAAWVRSDLAPIRDERPTHTVFYQPTKAPLSPAAKASVETLLRVADTLIDASRPERLFTTWSIADLDLAMMLQRLIANGDSVPEKVRSFAETQWRRPSVRKWVEHARSSYVPY